MSDAQLNCKLYPEIGWVAPDGKYYVAYDRTAEWLHYDIAIALVKAFHPEIDADDILEFNQMSYWRIMAQLGYVRVDIAMTALENDECDSQPTDQQFDTLFNLYQMKGWVVDSAPEGIRRFLVEHGNGQFEFLRKDSDYRSPNH